MNPNKNSVKETICISTIDEYCIQNNIKNIDLLKIDTEGYEMNVLEGAFDMLKGKKISFIFCEVGFLQSNKRNTSFSELCEYLSLKGFNFYSLYQMSDHDWKNGNVFANALFVNKLINT